MDNVFNVELLTERYLKFLQRLPDKAWYIGSTWYADAYNIAEEIGQGIDPKISAAVIAALSPQCRWERNVRLAAHMINNFIHGRPCPRLTTTTRINKAWNILTHHSPHFLNGPKERAFYLDIMGDLNAVTLDSHMSFILLGFNKGKFTPNQYRIGSTAVTHGANAYGVAPTVAQAGSWWWMRELRPYKKGVYRWWEYASAVRVSSSSSYLQRL